MASGDVRIGIKSEQPDQIPEIVGLLGLEICPRQRAIAAEEKNACRLGEKLFFIAQRIGVVGIGVILFCLFVEEQHRWVPKALRHHIKMISVKQFVK
jgi:hypothetical protein